MRFVLLLAAFSMPVVAWLSVRGTLGPDPASLSAQYPTLLVAAGYAFSIWGVIFALDLAYAVWQLRRRRAERLEPITTVMTLGFALTAAWMPIFAQRWFVLALVVIWAALACMLYCAIRLARGYRHRWVAWPAALHAGWLSLAAFLNTAQVVVAQQWLSTQVQLPWSLLLLFAAWALLLVANARLRGQAAYTVAVVWGLAAVFVEQRTSTLDGSTVTAWLALLIAATLVIQTVRLRRHAHAAVVNAQV